MATYTENGALSYPANDPLLDLFYRALRNTPESKMREMVRAAWVGPADEPATMKGVRQLYTLKLLFHLRWCRGGKGERNMFRIGMSELLQCGASAHVLANLENFPHFGYWKDLLYFLSTDIEKPVLKLYTRQLQEDLEHLRKGEQITLAGKWAPSEGKEMDCKHKAVNKFAAELGMTKAAYRKQCLVPLRKQARIVETQMCQGDWKHINYAAVPSLARLRYSKSFRKHDEARFDQYMKNVAAGKEKMNIKLVFPYQLVEKYVSSGSYYPNESGKYPSDEDLTVMWDELVRQVRADLVVAGADLQALGVADVSGSMSGVPIQNSVALSLLWAELCEGQFAGHFYTFCSRPQLIKIQGTSLREKVQSVMQHVHYDNTNVQALFEDMLRNAQMWQVPVSKYPKRIYMFTDGQFDMMTCSGSATCLDMVQQKHQAAGYPVPELIFWNLRGDTVDFPSPGDRKGVAMLSGFSPSLMQLILKGKDISPSGIMLQALNDPELDRVKLA